MTRQITDASLEVSIALPDGAAAVTSAGIDTKTGTRGDFVAGVDILIQAPALATGELGDAETMTYDLQTDNDSAFGSPTTLYPGVLVQTGAGGAGAAADTVRVALASDAERYIRLKATNSGSDDATGKEATIGLRF